jgi:class 3 adenylate cyclase
MRVMGMALKWREYPFEWIKDREHSVFRWYSNGPVAAIWNKVTLEPLSDGGCQLRHDIWMTPRGVLGQVAAFVEGTKLGQSIEKFYRHLDDVIVAGGHVDPFEPPHSPTPETRAAVERACAQLHADGFDSGVVEKLAMYLLTAPDGVLRTMRPFELADAWSLDREAVFTAMIHAAHVGLLEPAWDVVCPLCQLAHESVSELSQVKRMGTCKACAKSFERDLRDSVELVFTPNPNIRRLHHLTYCAGAPALRPHVLVQQVLDPGATRTVTVRVPRGVYRIAASSMTTPSEFVASAVGFEEKAEATVEAARVVARPAIVQAGPVTFELRNDTDREETIRIEVPGARVDGVSASTAMTHPKFREIFTGQLLAHGELLPVSQLSFLFVEMRERSTLFEKLDDAAACGELSRLDEIVREAAEAHEGTVVPSSLDLLVVAFPSPLLALRAGLEARRRVEESTFRAPVVLAAHDGRCIALTRGGKAEFFGETLHRGQSLLEECAPGGLALSASFAADRVVAVALHETNGVKVTVETSEAGPYRGRRIYMVRSVRTNT